MYGDEYFAELDYIEVVEQSKEGYEDFVDPEEYMNNEKGINTMYILYSIFILSC